ncbi:hypothetical protein HELRODRAFT_175913 [Helobdella robusta]|uniref:Reverse transcriptase domain-containing protein n=1 Tax=Helobdella robusta TaxID=6412 RepID=T1F9V6_HELRO|nr:hypothetical protein HELRODRAFT_175913 [Helobdella robusta]ESO00472.1 hypothetical protein HELRODRAFT_175913 [Helobdella robusta]
MYLCQLFTCYSFDQLITLPTRISVEKQSIIDCFFTNFPQQVLDNPEDALKHFISQAPNLMKDFTKNSEWKQTMHHKLSNSFFCLDISFEEVVETAKRKMAKALGVINKFRFNVPRRTLNMLYNAICVPYISYCNIVWAGTYRTITDPIRLIMKRAVNAYFTANFVYKQLTNKLPSIFNHYYSCSNNKRQNYIRSNSSKTNILFFHVYCRGPRIWNLLLKNNFKIDSMVAVQDELITSSIIVILPS